LVSARTRSRPSKFFHDSEQHGWASIRAISLGEKPHAPLRSLRPFLMRTFYNDAARALGLGPPRAVELFEAKALCGRREMLRPSARRDHQASLSRSLRPCDGAHRDRCRWMAHRRSPAPKFSRLPRIFASRPPRPEPPDASRNFALFSKWIMRAGSDSKRYWSRLSALPCHVRFCVARVAGCGENPPPAGSQLAVDPRNPHARCAAGGS